MVLARDGSSSRGEGICLRARNYANLRENSKLSLPKANSSKYGLNTFRCYGPNIWNSLHDDLRNAPTIKILCREFET